MPNAAAVSEATEAPDRKRFFTSPEFWKTTWLCAAIWTAFTAVGTSLGSMSIQTALIAGGSGLLVAYGFLFMQQRFEHQVSDD